MGLHYDNLMDYEKYIRACNITKTPRGVLSSRYFEHNFNDDLNAFKKSAGKYY